MRNAQLVQNELLVNVFSAASEDTNLRDLLDAS